MRIALSVLGVSLISLVTMAAGYAADGAAKPQDAPAAGAVNKKSIDVAEKNFKAQDKDSNGVLTFDEFKGNRKKTDAVALAELIFKLLDTDDDGKVTLKEFVERSAEAKFKQMDRDNDDKLTFVEFKGKREKPEELEQAEKNFKRMDANGDKAVSVEEFKASQKPAKKSGKSAGKKHQPK